MITSHVPIRDGYRFGRIGSPNRIKMDRPLRCLCANVSFQNVKINKKNVIFSLG